MLRRQLDVEFAIERRSTSNVFSAGTVEACKVHGSTARVRSRTSGVKGR